MFEGIVMRGRGLVGRLSGVVAGICLSGTSVLCFADSIVPPLPSPPVPAPPFYPAAVAPVSDIPESIAPVAIAPAVVSPVEMPLAAPFVQSGSATVVFKEEAWTMTISPAENVSSNAEKYRQAYESVPYRRSEYLANPGYRHDAAMELVFGQMRPTVVQRIDSAERVVNPRPVETQPYPMSQMELYRYRSIPYYGGVIPWLQPIP